MFSTSQRIRAHIAACMLVGAGFTGQAFGAIVHSGPIAIAVPVTTSGIYINVVTGVSNPVAAQAPNYDINPWSSTNFSLFGPTVNTWLSGNGLSTGNFNLPPGTLVTGPISSFYRPNNIGAQVALNSSANVFGFRFVNEANAGQVHMGWMRVQFGATLAERTVIEYAYENVADTPIAAGATKYGSTTSITSDTPDPSTAGAPVTVAFTVVPLAPATGTPTGDVTVSSGAASCTASVAVGQCTLSLTNVGDQTLTASYVGDAVFAASSDTETHAVQALLADLSIDKTANIGQLDLGIVQYTIVAANAGPTAVVGATVTDTFAAPQTNAEWTCTGSDGGTCAASGTGDINALVDLPADGSVEFTVVVDVPTPLLGTFTNTATIAAPGGIADDVPGNNSSTVTVAPVDLFADGFEDLLP